MSSVKDAPGQEKQEMFRWQTVCLLLSPLLEYPGHPDIWQRLPELRQRAEADGWVNIADAIDAWTRIGQTAMEQVYIETFDFGEATCLYLTAHEYGDSRERGAALLDLHQHLHGRGWQLPAHELPDYLPLLLEYLAVDPEGANEIRLPERVRVMCQRILERLPEGHLYRPVFELLTDALPAGGAPFPAVSHPDPVDLPVPYPLWSTHPEEPGPV